MQYTLDIYEKNPQNVLEILAKNCKARRLEKGYSRKTLSKLTDIPAPSIEHFERTGKISLESFCKIAIFFDYYNELASIMNTTKYSTSKELETINKNKKRQKGR